MPRRKRLTIPSMGDILGAVEEYLDRTGTAESAFGREVCGDYNLVRELRDGRVVTITTARAIAAKVNAK